MTGSIPNTYGSIWVTKANPHKEWQLHFSFNVFGRNQIGGDGFALWYAKEKEQYGPIYGSMDKWNGKNAINLRFDISKYYPSLRDRFGYIL
jgi:hypothetical protein